MPAPPTDRSTDRPGAPVSSGPVVVAAFEPFEGRHRNRSWEAVRRLPPRPDRTTVQLPVDFVGLPPAIAGLLAGRPRALLLVGEARRPRVSVEQLALNVADSDRPDNAGLLPRDRPLDPGGSAPLALRASWDARAVAEALRSQGVRAEASFHAGTFACNASLYLALATAPAPAPAIGFLHLPRAPWPVGPRLATLTRAVEIAAAALVGAAARSGPLAVTVRRHDFQDGVARALISALNAELSGRYPEEGATHFRLDADEVAAGRGAFVVAFDGEGRPVGCGAVRRIALGSGADAGEVKRMYVVPEARGRGVGAAVLAALEAEARALGLRRLVLETGERQPEALALYRRAGFADIPRFGAYLQSALSVCLGKTL
jgi:pyrrolidone-carboxylate peptidase/GNAT superfamily N-acetyltransferase